MKLNSLSFLLVMMYALQSCKPTTKPEDPKSRLAELKAQAKALNDEIKALQLQIAESDTSRQGAKSKLIQIDTLKTREFNHYVEVQGSIDADQNVMASPQMPGVVTAIYVKEGDVVPQGKILASLDASTLKKSMDELKTGLELATTLYNKQKRLWEQNIGSEAQYLQAKNQKEQLEQKLQTLQTQFSMSYIKAPVAGVVDEVNLKIGEMANPGFHGVRVVNNKEMSVKAKLSDRYNGQVKKGDKVVIYFPEENQSLDSKVSYTSQTINTRTRTFAIEAALPKSRLNYLSNQSVKLRIQTGSIKNTIVISSNLVQTGVQGDHYVLIAEPSNGMWYARKRQVKPGVTYHGETEIMEGIKAGEFIIKTGFGELVDGQLIAL